MREEHVVNDVPLYQRIFETLEGLIKNGVLKPGELLPSENELANEFNVSRDTVRKAMERLVFKGLIVRQRGRGSFVADARALSSVKEMPRARTVGVIFPYGQGNLAMRVMSGIEEVLSASGYHILYASSESDYLVQDQKVESFREYGVDGLLVMPVTRSKKPELSELKSLWRLYYEGFPLVCLDRRIEELDVPVVSSQNVDAMTDVVAHLYAVGHREMIMITPGDFYTTTIRDRRQGYAQALEAKGLKSSAKRIFTFDEVDWERLVEEKITAIVCTNDFVAVNVIKRLAEHNLSVPDDVAVTGFDNADVSEHITPPITTVDQDFAEIGRQAAGLFLRSIDGDRLTFKDSIYVPTRLIVRESSVIAKTRR